MAKVSIPGLTTEFTKENGDQTKCMEKERSHGPTVGNMLVSMPKIKSVVMENSYGQMEGAIEASGSMVSNMAKALM